MVIVDFGENALVFRLLLPSTVAFASIYSQMSLFTASIQMRWAWGRTDLPSLLLARSLFIITLLFELAEVCKVDTHRTYVPLSDTLNIAEWLVQFVQIEAVLLHHLLANVADKLLVALLASPHVHDWSICGDLLANLQVLRVIEARHCTVC